MSNIVTIFKKEFKAYFFSPIAYVLIGIFVMFSSYFFFTSTLSSGTATAEFVLWDMTAIIFLMTPLLTMKLMSEEKKLGTNQLLLTSPINLKDIILGKYFGALSIYLIMLLITFIYPIIMYYYAKINMASVLVGYLGAFLIGAAFIAIGLFASTLTENQIISGLLGYAFLIAFTVISSLGSVFQGNSSTVFNYLSIFDHFNNFSIGVLDLGDSFYYLSIIFIFIYVTIFSAQKSWGQR